MGDLDLDGFDFFVVNFLQELFGTSPCNTVSMFVNANAGESPPRFRRTSYIVSGIYRMLLDVP